MENNNYSCELIFQSTSERLLQALMTHNEMSELFDFLGLKGFKMLHEYQHLSESCSRSKLRSFYLNSHKKLLPEDNKSFETLVPNEWFKYKSSDVTSQVRKQYVEKLLASYYDWESGSVEFYEEKIFNLEQNKKYNLSEEFRELLQEASSELYCIEAMINRLKLCSYSESSISELDCYLKEKYCKKLRKIEKA